MLHTYPWFAHLGGVIVCCKSRLRQQLTEKLYGCGRCCSSAFLATFSGIVDPRCLKQMTSTCTSLYGLTNVGGRRFYTPGHGCSGPTCLGPHAPLSALIHLALHCSALSQVWVFEGILSCVHIETIVNIILITSGVCLKCLGDRHQYILLVLDLHSSF